MGRRNKKAKPDRPPSTTDIGDLLRRPQNFQRPEMAPQLEGLYYSFSEATELEEDDYGDGAVSRPTHTHPSLTEGKLKDMLGELHRNIAADIGVFRDEISGVVACLQNAELTTAAQESRLVFQQGRDRQTFMAALRGKTPLNFEGHSLTFYPDLSKATMAWRRSFRPLTTELMTQYTLSLVRTQYPDHTQRHW
ncbi:Hypothetical predicted protein [Pelobates cultripes]|uniref:Uncharacterized protein n=1 Tax=Pelobates cultripes TaxID=61616 RepID=A0AAD1TI35_PELCU|nr:Hypothetical predicted protein [Pelobates cultripes]